MKSTIQPQLPDQNNVYFSPQSYLERATWWLTSSAIPSISYASLELRFAFEAIVMNHGWASDNQSKAFTKLNWKPGDLLAKLRAEFSPALDITRSYRFYLEASDPGAQLVLRLGLQELDADGTLTTGYFLAMPDELFNMYGQLDENLHASWAGRDLRLPERPWYKTQHAFLCNLANRLIPHAHSKNGLRSINLKKMKFEEVDSIWLESLLRENTG